MQFFSIWYSRGGQIDNFPAIKIEVVELNHIQANLKQKQMLNIYAVWDICNSFFLKDEDIYEYTLIHWLTKFLPMNKNGFQTLFVN